MLTIRYDTLEGTFPFTPRYCNSNGFDMHYVDEGSSEPFVMLHGDPTWGYLYRNFIPPLAQHYRCIVPDHMGMGKSDVPQQRGRDCLEQHRANFESLMLSLDLRDITLIVHDWGGPVGLGFATRYPERIKRLVFRSCASGSSSIHTPQRTRSRMPATFCKKMPLNVSCP